MTLDDFIHIAREIRLDGVELTSYYFPETTDDYIYSLKRIVFQNGLDISGTAVGGAFTEPDKKKLAEHIKMVKEWVDISQKLGATVMRVFAGPEHNLQAQQPEVLDLRAMNPKNTRTA